jgi:16S rRNA processing protein RimM
MDLVLVGRIARAHGNKGQVIVNPDTDFAEERFRVGEVLLVGVAAAPKVIRGVRFHQGRPVLRLEGVETMSDAEDLAGAELRVPANASEALPDGTFYHYDLIGCEVRDTADRPIGPVTAVEGTMEMSPQRGAHSARCRYLRQHRCRGATDRHRSPGRAHRFERARSRRRATKLAAC